MELGFAQRLRQNVAQLFFAPDELYLDQTLFNRLPDQVVLHLNVLTLAVEYWILHQSNGGLIVHPQHWCSWC